MTILGQVLMLMGALVLVVAALGILRLPDALTRQHGVGLGVVAVTFIAIGLGFATSQGGWVVRLVLMVAAMMFMIPAAANMLARVASDEGRHTGLKPTDR